ncbi:MAG: PPOX class F420-dependent oxidoreductase [Chloroflexi bacterium]|nr:PPOX class F420-dependent oxidoreductase [Chloroflexota bacterium]
MQKMTANEAKAFLLTGTRTGKFASVRPDGRAHVAPVWFLLDGEDLLFTTWHESVKAKNIRHNPQVSLCVDDETPPFAFVLVEGTAVLEDNPTALAYWAAQIGGRYMGQEQAEAFGRRNSVPGELLVRLTPGKIIAQKDVAGW